MTASHQIAAVKTDVVTKPRKGNQKTKGKQQHSKPEAHNALASDEDNSLECEAALASPVTLSKKGTQVKF
jgi:hypothetical protein